jgi:hypothetical protein
VSEATMSMDGNDKKESFLKGNNSIIIGFPKQTGILCYATWWLELPVAQRMPDIAY